MAQCSLSSPVASLQPHQPVLLPCRSIRPPSTVATGHKQAPLHVTRRTLLATVIAALAQPQGSAIAGGKQQSSQDARAQVLDLLARGYDNYNHGSELGPAVRQLVASNRTQNPGTATMTIGQGTWEVFYAPHIAGLSRAMGTRFQPIRYILRGNEIISNVQYKAPLLGSGWLSASGTMCAKDADTLALKFDRFWVDADSAALRPELEAVSEEAGAAKVDTVLGPLGRATFLPRFAVFPVLYLDEDLAVFRFPPLNSNIAVRRVF